MARLVGKPNDPQNGYPWVGTVTLLKDAQLFTMKNGKKQWKAFGTFEKAAKGDRSGKNAVSMTTGFDDELASKLIAWPKGTRLFVQGSMVKSEYWTQRNGRESFELVVEYVHDQHDYHAAQNDDMDRDAFGNAGEDDYGNQYDPGF